jgi:hypothetical protein
MAAQLAVEALSAKRVVAKINDPVRATAYAELGIATICRTGLMMDAINAYLGLPASGIAGMLEPTGHHPGGEHHRHDAPEPAVVAATVQPTAASSATQEN